MPSTAIQDQEISKFKIFSSNHSLSRISSENKSMRKELVKKELLIAKLLKQNNYSGSFENFVNKNI